MKRRDLFHSAWKALLWLVAAMAAWPVFSFVAWRRPGHRLVVFSADERRPYAFKEDVYLVPGEGGLEAVSASCPHLCCSVAFDAAARTFRCPCHRSVFDSRGERVSGPAPSGLKRLPVAERGNGDLEVRKPASG